LNESPAVLWLAMALMCAAYGLATVLADRRWQVMVLRLPGYVVLGAGVAVATMQTLAVGVDQFPGYRPIGNLTFMQGILMTGILVWVARMLNRSGAKLQRHETWLSRPALYAANLFLLLKLSQELIAVIAWPDAYSWRAHGNPVWLWMLPMWSAYGIATVYFSHRWRFSCLRYPGYGVLGLATAGSFLQTIGAGVGLVGTYRPLWNQPFVLGVVMTGLLALLAWYLHRADDRLRPAEVRLRTPAILIPILYFFLKVTLEVVAFFKLGVDASAASMLVKSQLTVSLVWGVYAGSVIWIGFARRFKPVRLLGMSLLGMTIAKVFLLDMQSLDRGYWIAAFIGLGVLLLVISLLYQRDRQTREKTES